MKLRNKKTGEVVDLSIFGIELNIRKENQPIYRSLAELNEEWEDYEPKEPLIKDKKICKAVRAWAEANGDSTIVVHPIDGETTLLNGSFTGLNIEFYIMDELEDGKDYTIDELCGEEAPEPLEPSFIDLDERIREKAATEKLYKGENDMHLVGEDE